MDVIEVILLSFGGTTVALLVVGFFGKSLASHWFSKELENYKAKINLENNQSLEILKNNLLQSLRRDERSSELELLMNKYKAPLTHAAFDLQSRIYNLVQQNITEIYFTHTNGDEDTQKYFLKNTVFVISQYFAWTEIIRREIQFIEFKNSSISKKLSDLQDTIYGLWQSSRYSDNFQVWAGEQRGIGELMIEEQGGNLTCIGYASFLKKLDSAEEPLFTQLEKKVELFLNSGYSSSIRLIDLQNALIDMLYFLDPEYIRFPQDRRTKISI